MLDQITKKSSRLTQARLARGFRSAKEACRVFWMELLQLYPA
ncbi:hypothetical protein PU02_0690 [Bartonella ancashensis]|uniref:Mobile element protein n=1 Tax=Bartonella ancashensis TaxID=1318743 RepID=A0A0M4M5V4_9HYPH|nr:hypothetical protein PU02_0690 [Bartonella ancashensis]